MPNNDTGHYTGTSQEGMLKRWVLRRLQKKTRRGDGADMTWHVKSRCAYSDTQQTLRVTVIALSDTEGSSCYNSQYWPCQIRGYEQMRRARRILLLWTSWAGQGRTGASRCYCCDCTTHHNRPTTFLLCIIYLLFSYDLHLNCFYLYFFFCISCCHKITFVTHT